VNILRSNLFIIIYLFSFSILYGQDLRLDELKTDSLLHNLEKKDSFKKVYKKDLSKSIYKKNNNNDKSNEIKNLNRFKNIGQSIKSESSLLHNTRTRSFVSQINNEEYSIYIGLPVNYFKDKKKRYNVIYVLDTEWMFPLINSFTRLMSYQSSIMGINNNEYIVVSISDGSKYIDYKNRKYNDQKRRSRDYTFEKSIQKKEGFQTHAKEFEKLTGGSYKFGKILEDEIIENIDNTYRTNRSPEGRTLVGHSFSGLFALYYGMNFDKIKNISSISPSVWYNQGSLNKINSIKLIDKNIKIYVGDREFVGNNLLKHVLKFCKLHSSVVGLKCKVLDKEDHFSILPRAVSDYFKKF